MSKSKIKDYLSSKDCDDLLIELFKPEIKKKLKSINYSKSAKKVKDTFKQTEKLLKKSKMGREG